MNGISKFPLSRHHFQNQLGPDGNNRLTANDLLLNRHYERKIDEFLNLPWVGKKQFDAENLDDISGVRECFDDARYLQDNPSVVEAIQRAIVASAWEHWVEYGRMQRRFAQFKLPYEVLNDRHLDEDVYLIVDSSILNQFQPEIRELILNKTTIGKFSHNVGQPFSYVLVSNFRDLMIASKLLPASSSPVMLRSMNEPPSALKALTISHINLNTDDIFEKRGLPRYLTGPNAPLFGENEIFSALHMAFVFGARRILVIGDGELGSDETDEQKFLAEIITGIHRHGVEVITTATDSLLHEAGAVIQSIEKAVSPHDPSATMFGGNHLVNDGYGTESKSLFVAKAAGSWIIDRNGRHYLDTGMAAGSAILGHANSAIHEAIVDALEDGALYCKPTPSGEELGWRLSNAFPWFSRFALCNTGSEATMRLIRIARSFTGRSKIALFSGGWHGTHDFLLIDDDATGPEDRPTPFLRSSGSPDELLNLITLLPQSSEVAFEIIREQKEKLAAVIAEPIQGSNPKERDIEFMRQLRIVTRDAGVLLGFDEIITGGRLGVGGFQERYGIQADLAAYGKILGGGLPIGIVGGSEHIMKTVKEPEVRGASNSNANSIVLGGTFSGNPITVSAASCVLKLLSENADELYPYIDAAGQRIRQEINGFCRDNEIPAKMYGVGSICRLIMSDQEIRSARHRDEVEVPNHIQNEFYMSLLEEGIHVAGNRLIFISASHDDEQISTIIGGFTKNLEKFSEVIGR